MSASTACIRVGIGGWNYEPWRSNFYPEGLPHNQELQHASRQLTAIEINSTFYGSQKPQTFARWRDETPEGFVFSLKATRYATHRRVLAEAGDSVARFIDSGIAALGPKLGPVVWQFAPNKAFDADDFEAFLALLPAQVDGLALRHVMGLRHPSFKVPDYLALARKHGVATVFTDAEQHASFADVTGSLLYLRLMRSAAEVATGYAPETLDALAACARCWADGGEPDRLPRVELTAPAPAAPRDVFVFFINGAKERAPAAAMALLQRLAQPGGASSADQRGSV